MNAVAILAVVLLAEPSSSSGIARDGGPIIPPRDPHPFGAIETRPLWERTPPPSVVGSRELTLQRRTEDALDRGSGRIEDEATFDLRQADRDRALRDLDASGRDAMGLSPADRAAIDPARAEQERREQLEQRHLWLERERQRGRRLEREAETLAEVRRRFEQEASRADHATGAVVDRQLLAGVERDYRGAIAAAAKQHAASLAAIDADAKLSDADRATRRAAVEQAFERAQVDAARRWESRRQAVLGEK
jgi:hypothetical protein